MPEITRRTFLQMSGGGSAVLAAGTAERAFDRYYQYAAPSKNVDSTDWSFFATTCRECPAGCGMHLWHRFGRVTKAEGNPLHPVNSGALCPRGQSTVQGLYDPDRISAPLHRTGRGELAPTDWEAALGNIARLLERAESGVAVLSDLQTGALAEVMRAFCEAFGPDRVLFYEPFNYESLREAHRTVFGLPLIPEYRLDRCACIISFAADFLETWISPVQFAWDYSRMHDYSNGDMGRMLYIGPRLSLTAANAEEFISVSPGDLPRVAEALLSLLGQRGASVSTTPSETGAPLPTGVDRGQLAEWARRFMQSLGSVALAGPSGMDSAPARRLATAAALMNRAAGRLGDTVDFSRPHALSRTATREETLAFLSGLTKRDVLFIHQANPVYSIPGVNRLIRQAGTVVYLGTLPDETAALADWVLPIDSPLESWGEYEPYPGVNSLMQPVMGRIRDTRLNGDIFLDLARRAGKPLAPTGSGPATNFQSWLESRFGRDITGGAYRRPITEAWTEALQNGGVFSPSQARGTTAPAPSDGGAPAPPAVPEEPLAQGSVRLWIWSSIRLFDGRTANRGWLRENPEPVSGIAWDSWVDIHPHTAARLHLEQEDVVELKSAAGMVEAPIRITTQVTEDTVAIPFGLGHSTLGENAAGSGANPFALLGTDRTGEFFPRVTIRKTGHTRPLIFTVDSQDQHDRGIVRGISLADLRNMKPGEGEPLILPLPEGYRPDRDVYSPHPHRNHRWAMVIDLHRCIGCGACAVACYAENNLPVVGPEETRRRHFMAWLRVVPYADGGKPDRLEFLPMLCQHCDAAPCEPVCPVFAAVHNEEGLNAQIYNRCIGTRYCSNNCPYKVRRFNWMNIRWREPLQLQLNPEVTVRCRGVMEKCTFCVQRIRYAEYRAKRENRPVRDGEIVTACAQTCPTSAIVFGDLLDSESRVSRLTREDPRRYHVLEELNTKPAVTYLKRIYPDANRTV